MPRRSKRKLLELQRESEAAEPVASLRNPENTTQKKKRRIVSRKTRNRSDVTAETPSDQARVQSGRARRVKRTSVASAELTARLDAEDNSGDDRPAPAKRRLRQQNQSMDNDGELNDSRMVDTETDGESMMATVERRPRKAGKKKRISESKDLSPVLKPSMKAQKRRRVTEGHLETIKRTPPLDHAGESDEGKEESEDESSSVQIAHSPRSGRKARASHKVENKKRKKRKSLLHDSEDDEIEQQKRVQQIGNEDSGSDTESEPNSSSDESLNSDPVISQSLSHIRRSPPISAVPQRTSPMRPPSEPNPWPSVPQTEVFPSSSIQSATTVPTVHPAPDVAPPSAPRWFGLPPSFGINLPKLYESDFPPKMTEMNDSRTHRTRSPRKSAVIRPSDAQRNNASPEQPIVRPLEENRTRVSVKRQTIRRSPRKGPSTIEAESVSESGWTQTWISVAALDSIFQSIVQLLRNALFTVLCAVVIFILVRALISNSGAVIAIGNAIWRIGKNGASLAATTLRVRKPYCDTGVIVYDDDESQCVQCPMNALCTNGVVHCDIDDSMVFDAEKGECVRDASKLSALLSGIELKSYAILTQVSGDFQCNNQLRYVRHNDESDNSQSPSELEEWLKTGLYQLWETSNQSRQRFREVMDDARRMKQTPWITQEYLKSVLMDELNVAPNGWAFDDSWDSFIRNASRNSFSRNSGSPGIYAQSHHKQWPYSRLQYHPTLLSIRSKDAYRPLGCHLTLFILSHLSRIVFTLSAVCLVSCMVYSWRKRTFIAQRSTETISAVMDHLGQNRGSPLPSGDIRSQILGDFDVIDRTNGSTSSSRFNSRPNRRRSMGLPRTTGVSAILTEGKLKALFSQLKRTLWAVCTAVMFIAQCKCCFLREYWMSDPAIKSQIWRNVEEAMQRRSTVQVSLRRMGGTDRVCWKFTG